MYAWDDHGRHAHTTMGHCQCLPQAMATAQKALHMDDEIAESHIALGRFKLWHDWDFAEATSRFEEGIRIDHVGGEGFMHLGAVNMSTGNRGA